MPSRTSWQPAAVAPTLTCWRRCCFCPATVMSAGMSHLEAQELMGLVGRLKERGTTILLIEHNMHLVMSHSDKIVVLNFGKRIAEGSATAIRTNPEVIEA